MRGLPHPRCLQWCRDPLPVLMSSWVVTLSLIADHRPHDPDVLHRNPLPSSSQALLLLPCSSLLSSSSTQCWHIRPATSPYRLHLIDHPPPRRPSLLPSSALGRRQSIPSTRCWHLEPPVTHFSPRLKCLPHRPSCKCRLPQHTPALPAGRDRTRCSTYCTSRETTPPDPTALPPPAARRRLLWISHAARGASERPAST
ncbi:hypothetical protein BDY17DRAFT_84998 [Neohortaea acidophila]|uniref:Uncharacterized protein n=1 Tax=Neohortaea acidophila TaxID=245834 RepID=A0A6A6Q3V8_9PEZI|nr:uncharacterized protein BDY17DRAFT_84998 [Neohortaea acidophila]KAF2486741.1 hypothetical protein BDY17DRAFT_84998 [Neohortaea acidophila]